MLHGFEYNKVLNFLWVPNFPNMGNSKFHASVPNINYDHLSGCRSPMAPKSAANPRKLSNMEVIKKTPGNLFVSFQALIPSKYYTAV